MVIKSSPILRVYRGIRATIGVNLRKNIGGDRNGIKIQIFLTGDTS
ncbi:MULTISPECIES: hypothetical protein [Planktothrix]|nr:MULTISPECIES: hypothetical protein [Planktothrix]MBG0748993.1 hypothetical protein [Planktothrix agardhii KL2]MCF3573900.1 hypothetical protein [Planktothrix agardhii 1812]MCF3596662.1 hypothetical protein [Planktothrix agardhii 1032]MCF3626855.1 hypothetical protein [Planktothrix agardhii 1801]